MPAATLDHLCFAWPDGSSYWTTCRVHSATAVPDGEIRPLDGQNHQVDQGVLAGVLAGFFGD